MCLSLEAETAFLRWTVDNEMFCYPERLRRFQALLNEIPGESPAASSPFMVVLPKFLQDGECLATERLTRIDPEGAQMIDYPCGLPECIFCALHCPYCGQWPIVLEVQDGQMRCPTCGETEDLVHPKLIEIRHRQVLALTGRTIADWKVRARQLSPGFHHRWRTALGYLAPAACAAIARADDLQVVGWDEEQALAQAKADMAELERLAAESPRAYSEQPDDLEAFLDDWS
jgi:hypothetical protein